MRTFVAVCLQDMGTVLQADGVQTLQALPKGDADLVLLDCATRRGRAHISGRSANLIQVVRAEK